MVKILKKLNKTAKLNIVENVKVFNESFSIEAQITVIPCHPEDATINNLPYQFTVERDDFVKVNDEHVYYTKSEIQDILESPELKNLILKQIVKKIFK